MKNVEKLGWLSGVVDGLPQLLEAMTNYPQAACALMVLIVIIMRKQP